MTPPATGPGNPRCRKVKNEATTFKITTCCRSPWEREFLNGSSDVCTVHTTMPKKKQVEECCEQEKSLLQKCRLASAIFENDLASIQDILEQSIPNGASVKDVNLPKSVGESFTGGRSTLCIPFKPLYIGRARKVFSTKCPSVSAIFNKDLASYQDILEQSIPVVGQRCESDQICW
jgi:hypothetical protein